MAVSWTEAATRDRIYDHIEADNPAAAIRMDGRSAAAAAAEGLGSFPPLGRNGRVAGTRELVDHQNYFLVYAVAEAGPRILRIRHVAQRRPN